MWAGTFDITKLGEMPQRATVFDMDGNPYSTLHVGENRTLVPIDKVSPHFLDALVAREDTRFYSHHGVDPHGIARAIVRNITRRRAAEGASTLTQQLARNSLPLGGKTLTRKILEAFVAARIERHYNKRQILDFYVNRIYYGGGMYGIETASEAYFGKPSADLDLSESAMMAGLIRSPNHFSPWANLAGANRERDTVLDRMAELHKITPAEADAAKHETIRVVHNRASGVQDNYAMDAVQAELATLLSNNEQTTRAASKSTPPSTRRCRPSPRRRSRRSWPKIEARPGYEHPKKGQHPDADESKGTDYLQGALVLIDNRDGSIRALVGGREYKPKAFNRAMDPPGRRSARRSSPSFTPRRGSAGLLPGANIDDGAIQPGELKDAPDWHPGNSDGTFGPVQPAENGLIRSRNTMSVRVGELVGLDEVRKVANSAGLGDDIPPDPTILSGHVQHHAHQADRGLHAVCQRGPASPGPFHRTHRRRRRPDDLPRRPRGEAGPPARRDVDHAHDPRKSDGPGRHGGGRACAGVHRPRRGQDRHDQRFQGRVVCRVHDQPDLRRLGGHGPPADDHRQGLRRGAGAADLVSGRGEGVAAAVSVEGVPAARAAQAGARVPVFQRTGHGRLPGGRHGVHH